MKEVIYFSKRSSVITSMFLSMEEYYQTVCQSNFTERVTEKIFSHHSFINSLLLPIAISINVDAVWVEHLATEQHLNSCF